MSSRSSVGLFPLSSRPLNLQFQRFRKVPALRAAFITLRKTFRKVYWSPRSVCVYVCLFVCLSSKALQAAPLVRSSWFLLQKMSSGHATMQNFFFWQSDKGQGQGHHFCENQIMAITFEPEVTETSGGVQNVPYIFPLLQEPPMLRRTTSRFYITWL